MQETSGYRLVLPPGWVQVPVRDATPGTAREVVVAAFRKPPEGIPRDAFTGAKIELERRLEKMIRKAKNEGGLELFLACGQAYANPVPASFLIAEGSLGSSTDDPLAVVTAIAEGAARDGGKPGELTALDGAPAARVERIAAPRDGDDEPSLRVAVHRARPRQRRPVDGRHLLHSRRRRPLRRIRRYARRTVRRDPVYLSLDLTTPPGRRGFCRWPWIKLGRYRPGLARQKPGHGRRVIRARPGFPSRGSPEPSRDVP